MLVEVITELLQRDLFIIVRDYLSLEDLFMLEYTWDDKLLTDRLWNAHKIRGRTWSAIASHLTPKSADMLTSYILLRRSRPLIGLKQVQVQDSPLLLIAALMYSRANEETLLDNFITCKVSSLPQKRLFAILPIDFSTILGNVCVKYIAYDPDFSDLILANPGFDNTAANLHFPWFLEHYPPGAEVILSKYNLNINALLARLDNAIRHSTIVHSILTHLVDIKSCSTSRFIL